jgi:replicative DNA helicase
MNELKNELELQVLSVMLDDPQIISNVHQIITAEDFSPENRELFTKITEFSHINDKLGLVIDLSKLNIENWGIKELNELQLKGNENSLERLYFNNVFEQLKDIRIANDLTDLLKSKIEELKTDTCGLEQALEIRSEIDYIIKTTDNLKDDKSFSENLPEILSSIEEEMKPNSRGSVTLKNFPSFNNSTGGLKHSNLVGIAGTYKSGKTTFGLNIVLDIAKQMIPCGFFSLELSQAELNKKLLGMLSRVEYENLREPKKLDAKSKEKLSEIYRENSKLPLYTSDRLLTEFELKNKARYWKERFGVKVICIDYLGYMRSHKKFDNREREMSYHSGFLKQMAKELDIVIIVLAQLNRQGRKEPSTEYLAESIALARDCDFLFIIYNPLEIGIYRDQDIEYNESHFLVKLDTTRHTRFKKQFLLTMNDDSNFVETATEYNNDYLERLVEENKHLLYEEKI